MSTRMFGARIERNIDPKLLRGEGAFVDDIPLAGVQPSPEPVQQPHRNRQPRVDKAGRTEADGFAGIVLNQHYGRSQGLSRNHLPVTTTTTTTTATFLCFHA